MGTGGGIGSARLSDHRVIVLLLSLLFAFGIANGGRQWVRAQLPDANRLKREI